MEPLSLVEVEVELSDFELELLLELESELLLELESELLLELESELPPLSLEELLELALESPFLDSGFSPSGFLFLKSVSYQPVPLRWKDGADNSFLSATASHDGQSVSGSALIFWMASN